MTTCLRFPNSILAPTNKSKLATNEQARSAAATQAGPHCARHATKSRGWAAAHRQAARACRSRLAARDRAHDRRRTHRAQWGKAHHARDPAQRPERRHCRWKSSSAGGVDATVPLLQAARHDHRGSRPEGPGDDLRPAPAGTAAADAGRAARLHDRGAAASDQ